MRGEVHILVHCPIDTLQWGSTHSALVEKKLTDIYQYSENSRCSYTVDLCKTQSTETR